MNLSSGRRLLRAKGPAPYQPRATPWVTRRKDHPSPEGAAQPVRRRPMDRPFRAKLGGVAKPRAMPWAGMSRTVGAGNPATLHARRRGFNNKVGNLSYVQPLGSGRRGLYQRSLPWCG